MSELVAELRAAKALEERPSTSVRLMRGVGEVWGGMGAGGRGAFEFRLEIAMGMISGGGSIEDGLRKDKPEFNSDASFRDAGVNSSRIDSGPKHEIKSNTSTVSVRIDSDQRCDRIAAMVTEAKIDNVLRDGEESSTEGRTDGSSFLIGIVRTARNMVTCSDQFS